MLLCVCAYLGYFFTKWRLLEKSNCEFRKKCAFDCYLLIYLCIFVFRFQVRLVQGTPPCQADLIRVVEDEKELHYWDGEDFVRRRSVRIVLCFELFGFAFWSLFLFFGVGASITSAPNALHGRQHDRGTKRTIPAPSLTICNTLTYLPSWSFLKPTALSRLHLKTYVIFYNICMYILYIPFTLYVIVCVYIYIQYFQKGGGSAAEWRRSRFKHNPDVDISEAVGRPGSPMSRFDSSIVERHGSMANTLEHFWLEVLVFKVEILSVAPLFLVVMVFLGHFIWKVMFSAFDILFHTSISSRWPRDACISELFCFI